MTTWGLGDYPSMAATLVDASRAAVQWCEVRTGDHVLDLATGTGNAALLAAAEGGDVVGIDAEPVLLSLAQRRSARAGLNVQWRQADLATTGVADGWADVVISVFGLMWGSEAHATMREVARCAHRPGRVVTAAWLPGSTLPRLGAAMAPFLPPPPPGMTAPSQWGDESWVTTTWESVGLTIESHRHLAIHWSFRDARAATDFFIASAGHVAAARSDLESEGRFDDLENDVHRAVEECGRMSGGAFEVDGEYLLTRAVAS
jgi:SAM-dependent methyltransferase